MFPLLLLPFLALKTVLVQLSPNELLPLSFCSLKIQNLIKSIKSKNVEIVLRVGNSNGLCIEYENDESIALDVNSMNDLPENLPIVKIGESRVFLEVYRNDSTKDQSIFYTYWQDTKVGIQECVKYGMQLFRQPIYCLSVIDTNPRWTINWIKSYQDSISDCYIESDVPVDLQEVSYLLQNLNVTKHLDIDLQERDQGVVNGPFEMKSLYMNSSKWVNIDNLISMNCEFILLENSQLTNQDINGFLKYWIGGNCSMLIEFCVELEIFVNYDIALDGIKIERREMNVIRHYFDQDNTPVTVIGGFDIQYGEKLATVFDDGDWSTEFRMVIWK